MYNTENKNYMIQTTNKLDKNKIIVLQRNNPSKEIIEIKKERKNLLIKMYNPPKNKQLYLVKRQ